MLNGPLISAEQFLEDRSNYPDAGQGSELDEGRLIQLQPPDLDHGNTLLNLGKALGGYFAPHRPGYACFDLGLIVQRTPATIFFPAVSLFFAGPRFGESEKVATDVCPEMIIELTSTDDRRQRYAERIRTWFDHGAQQVWHIDPAARRVMLSTAAGHSQSFEENDRVPGGPLLPELEIAVSSLFREPEWWR